MVSLNILDLLSSIGLYIQNKLQDTPPADGGQSLVVTIVLALILVFYTASIIIAFFLYREFKQMSYLGQSGGYANPLDMLGDSSDEEANEETKLRK